MTIEKIRECLLNIFIDELEIDLYEIVEDIKIRNNKTVDINTLSMKDEIGVDSLVYVDLISSMEIKFDIEVYMQDLENIDTLEQLSFIILEKMNQKDAGCLKD
ncbi:acyl carrier protein [Culturomica massiliensis]|jgi:acyl carrier protein|uniref:acyl carrier protein n=1 Tax=Culturomica massiliensis TaxID=1841857 RepID=UPI0023566788|nr:phosphopantetheine-binding protein [Culturomica massiliensis]